MCKNTGGQLLCNICYRPATTNGKNGPRCNDHLSDAFTPKNGLEYYGDTVEDVKSVFGKIDDQIQLDDSIG